MFAGNATIYDLIYSGKDYGKEARDVISMIKSSHPHARNILDIGCGTAEHHKYLRKEFQVDGLDINEDFIRSARTKNESGSYFVMDMADFNLDKRYDVILCLFSAIGYLLTIDKVLSTLKQIKKHLNDGGLAMVEPWFTPATWYSGRLHMLTYDREDIKICRMNISETNGNRSVINFHFLIATPDKGVTHFVEHHELALYSKEEMEAAFSEAGFKVSYDEEGLIGRGMYFATNKFPENSVNSYPLSSNTLL